MKNPIYSIIILAIAGTSPFAIADDLVFLPRLTTGYMNYKLETLSPLPGVPPQEFQVNVAVIGAGATFLWNHLYLDGYGQISSNGSANSAFPILNYNEKIDGNITDYSLTAGLNITDNLSIYVGYKYNKLDVSGNKGMNTSFKTDGYFLGASYGWTMESGVLAFNLAIADLDGIINTQLPAIPLQFDETSNAQGLSYGISWRSNINKNWGYLIAIDGNQYNFKDVVDKHLGEQPGEIKQDFFTIRISVSYLFD